MIKSPVRVCQSLSARRSTLIATTSSLIARRSLGAIPVVCRLHRYCYRASKQKDSGTTTLTRALLI